MTTMSTARPCLILVLLTTAGFATFADQVVMQNGDRYNGRILSVSPTNVVLQSEVLGMLNLSRGKVASLAMGTGPTTNTAPAATPSRSNAPTELDAAVRQLGTQSNLVNLVRAQFLATANPEAGQKFDKMLTDLGTGRMSVADLRAEARAAAAQLRELEKEAGDDTGGTTELYLSILDRFLAETEPSTPATNKPALQKKR